MNSQAITITISGPQGSGKSRAASVLKRNLWDAGFVFEDFGSHPMSEACARKLTAELEKRAAGRPCAIIKEVLELRTDTVDTFAFKAGSVKPFLVDEMEPAPMDRERCQAVLDAARAA
jgi:cytidylate kinase